MSFFKYILIGISHFVVLALFSEESHSVEVIHEQKIDHVNREEFVETHHRLVIDGHPIDYRAVLGNLVLENDKGQPNANFVFISYTAENNSQAGSRPISFCFNGGPGSSSVWLHLGVLGPKRVLLNDNGEALLPYRLIDNEFSLLDTTDLVFIDPVSTGYSHAVPDKEAKHFHGVAEDIKSVAEFIRLYLTRFNRWDSPKFIIGESYGTTRAVGLAGVLRDQYYVYVDGLVLISSILNFASIDFCAGNDLPYLLFLPSYTATAWYHQKLNPKLQDNLANALKISADFVSNEYASALFKGELLSAQEKTLIAEKLAELTGLSTAYIERNNLRIDMDHFSKELLRSQSRIIGRFDSRFKGFNEDITSDKFGYDPSASAIFGAFTATFNHYVRNNLKFTKDAHYKILSDVHPWNYGANNRCLDVTTALRDTMINNPYMKIFVGSGYFDLATPFFATEYTFNHLWLDKTLRNNITMKLYEAGHMMYIYRPSLIQLRKDLVSFYNQISLADNPLAMKAPPH